MVKAMNDYIEFQMKNYPIRELISKEFGYMRISTQSLNEAIMKDGDYVSDEAQHIDEGILYYVHDSEISLSDDMLLSIAERGVSL
jgi:hypothetical protein